MHPAHPQLVSSTQRPGIWLTPLLSNISTVIVQGLMTYKIVAFARSMRVSYGRKRDVAVVVLCGLLVVGVLIDMVFGLTFPILSAVSGVRVKLVRHGHVPALWRSQLLLFANPRPS